MDDNTDYVYGTLDSNASRRVLNYFDNSFKAHMNNKQAILDAREQSNRSI